ncbi:glycosyltransferase family 4 protein [Sphingomonas sp.]|uniref:glycosyltransferase family 4 protein n=1 Tax=Sphingomonas sp. TaxID=28214 RepID=UPI0035BC7A44
MRILITADAVGGVWQYTLDLVAALRPMGVEAIVALLGPSLTAAQRRDGAGVTLIETGLPLDWLSDGPDKVLAAGDAIAALAARERVDLVQLNMPSLGARARFGVPVVAVAHGCVGTWWEAARGTRPDPAYAWQDALVRAGLLAADAVVAPSQSYAETVARYYTLPAVPLAVHNGRAPFIARPHDADPPPSVRAERSRSTSPSHLPFDFAQGEREISQSQPTDADAEPVAHAFTAGRLWDEVKATALLDRTAARLSVPFRAAGSAEGPHGERLQLDHLHRLGQLDAPAMARELAGRPVFVSAARFEPFGLAVLEAAQAGCPLVLSGIDTFRELWTGAALIVEEQDDAAYAAAIERILGDAALRAHLGEAARIRAQRYTPTAMASAMASIYAGLIGAPRQAAA